MKTIRKLDNIMDWGTKIVGFVSVLALLFMMLMTVYDVFSRTVLKSAVIGSSEYVTMAETIVIFFALAYTQHNHGLVHVTFFMKKLPKLSPLVLWIFHEWVGTLVAFFLTYASYLYIGFVAKTKMATNALLIPYKPFVILMTIGMAAYAITQLYSAIRATTGLFNKEVREDVIENWPA